MKTCPKCDTRLPADSFHRAKVNADGRKTVCSLCTIEIKSEYNAAHRDLIRESNKAWLKKHPEHRKAKKKRWKASQRKSLGGGYIRNLIRDRGKFSGRKGVRIYLSGMTVPHHIVECKRQILLSKRDA